MKPLSIRGNRAIENAQRKVEGRNFDIRKQLLEYDDVANDQRKVIYEQAMSFLMKAILARLSRLFVKTLFQASMSTFRHSLEEMGCKRT